MPPAGSTPTASREWGGRPSTAHGLVGVVLCALFATPAATQDCDGNGVPDHEQLRRPLSFEAPRFVSVGDEPTTLVVADLDDDGRLDIAVTETKSNGVRRLWNAGPTPDGLRFDLDSLGCLGVDPRGLAVADLDGDGLIDLVAGSEARADDPAEAVRARLTVRPGAPGRQLSPLCPEPCDGAAASCPTADFVALERAVDAIRTLELADLDGDGALDAVVGFRNGELGVVTALRGTGDGRFEPPVEVSAAPLGDSRYIALGDLDGDGAIDVVSAAGEWLPGPLLAGGATARRLGLPEAVAKGVAIADVDGDGRSDVLLARTARSIVGPGGGELVVLRNEGEARLRRVPQPALSGLCDLQESILVADLDGDESLDVVVLHVGDPLGGVCASAGLSVLLGDGAGAFSPGVFVALEIGLPRWVEAGDLDADGDLDLVVAVDVPGAPRDVVAVLLQSRGPHPEDRDADGILDVCELHRGDVDGDLRLTLTDAITILVHLFRGPAALDCLEAADVDDDGQVVVSDAIGLLDHLFRGGPPPAPPVLAAPGRCEQQPSEWVDPNGSLSCSPRCAAAR